MPDEPLNDWCKRVGACEDAVDWVGARDWKIAWDECERGDWMLWALARLLGEPGWPTGQQIVLCACDIAETVLEHVPEGDDRPRFAIDAARRWANGECELADVECAGSAAASARYAAASAASAAASALYASYASYAAYFAAFAAARDAQLKRFADMIRARFTDLPFMQAATASDKGESDA